MAGRALDVVVWAQDVVGRAPGRGRAPGQGRALAVAMPGRCAGRDGAGRTLAVAGRGGRWKWRGGRWPWRALAAGLAAPRITIVESSKEEFLPWQYSYFNVFRYCLS